MANSFNVRDTSNILSIRQLGGGRNDKEFGIRQPWAPISDLLLITSPWQLKHSEAPSSHELDEELLALIGCGKIKYLERVPSLY